jgi:hypothetical protein
VEGPSAALDQSPPAERRAVSFAAHRDGRSAPVRLSLLSHRSALFFARHVKWRGEPSTWSRASRRARHSVLVQSGSVAWRVRRAHGLYLDLVSLGLRLSCSSYQQPGQMAPGSGKRQGASKKAKLDASPVDLVPVDENDVALACTQAEEKPTITLKLADAAGVGLRRNERQNGGHRVEVADGAPEEAGPSR